MNESERAKRGEAVRVTEEQRKEIHKAMIDKDISLKEFANMCNMSSGAVSPALNGKITISPRIRKIVRTVLNIDLDAVPAEV